MCVSNIKELLKQVFMHE